MSPEVSTLERDVIVLGGGVAGLAAASMLGDAAVVFERADRPGGLVRSERFGAYWFDHVTHLLHFKHAATENRVMRLIGDVLQPCEPDAWVEGLSGTTRYPLQLNLAGLSAETMIRCLVDLATTTFRPDSEPAYDLEKFLLRQFGAGMCTEFLFPYNQKIWRRPLSDLAPDGYTWTMTTADFEQVLRGALLGESGLKPYNQNAWYPCPPPDAPLRGMEVLPYALSNDVADLRLNHVVREIDAEERTVTVQHGGHPRHWRYLHACCSTLPLAFTLRVCKQTPPALRKAAACLETTRVLSVCLCIEGPRPTECGMWRYYADPDIVFSRVAFLHQWDPYSAPLNGWGLLAEVSQAEHEAIPDFGELLRRTVADARLRGALPTDCVVTDGHVLVIEQGRDVLTTEARDVAKAGLQFLEAAGISSVGRYARWEYLSMAQALHQGYSWGERIAERLTACVDACSAASPSFRVV